MTHLCGINKLSFSYIRKKKKKSECIFGFLLPFVHNFEIKSTVYQKLQKNFLPLGHYILILLKTSEVLFEKQTYIQVSIEGKSSPI